MKFLGLQVCWKISS